MEMNGCKFLVLNVSLKYLRQASYIGRVNILYIHTPSVIVGMVDPVIHKIMKMVPISVM